MPKPKPPRPQLRLTKDHVVLTVAMGRRTDLRVEYRTERLVAALNDLADKLRRNWPLTKGGERLLAGPLREHAADSARYLELLAGRIRRRRELTRLDEYAISTYLLGEAVAHLRLPPR